MKISSCGGWSSSALSMTFPFRSTLERTLQPSNPLLLVNIIQANPRTKFILFHGGYPWVSETGAMAFHFNTVLAGAAAFAERLD